MDRVAQLSFDLEYTAIVQLFVRGFDEAEPSFRRVLEVCDGDELGPRQLGTVDLRVGFLDGVAEFLRGDLLGVSLELSSRTPEVRRAPAWVPGLARRPAIPEFVAFLERTADDARLFARMFLAVLLPVRHGSSLLLSPDTRIEPVQPGALEDR